jgi:dolichyl-diphosphooligosaccharide--protein glycosyltransferase
MVTSGAIYHALRFLTLPVDIRNICVLLAPAFSGLTAWATYLLTTEMSDSPSAGLLGAIFMGIAPGYISRSVAGSYDNEAIAIFLLVYTFYLWIKAVKVGSIMWSGLAALFYGYMVSAWGGYVFITNLLPLHAFVLICMGRFSPRLYVSYTTWYALGTLASMQIPFVGFLPVKSSDHMAALGRRGLGGYPAQSWLTDMQVFLDSFNSLPSLNMSELSYHRSSFSCFYAQWCSLCSPSRLAASSSSRFLAPLPPGVVDSTPFGTQVTPRSTFRSLLRFLNISLPLGHRSSSI